MRLRLVSILTAGALLLGQLTGCGSAASTPQAPAPAQTSCAQPASLPQTGSAGGYTAPPMEVSVFDQASASGENGVLLDTSHLSDGYVAVQANSDGKLKFLLTYQGEAANGAPTQYSYRLPGDGTPVIIPLQLGDGTYEFAVCKNISGTKYSFLYRQTETVGLSSEFAPYLRPSIYINYSEDSSCVAKAAELAAQASDTVGVVANIYDYIIHNVRYDTAKADSIGTDYYSDPDETFATGQGICVDYAALAAAMLRSQGIPTKLITGYVAPNDLYHAWNMIWLEETGWITVSFEVDENNWNRVDTTFAAGGAGSEYIGDGSNYTDYRTY